MKRQERWAEERVGTNITSKSKSYDTTGYQYRPKRDGEEETPYKSK